MNAISKKLLSFAIVLAMVLSMTPVISLPAAAAITAEPTTLAEAQENKRIVDEWVAANSAAFTNGGTLPTTCPACGATNVTWTPVGADRADVNNAVAKGTHAYFSAGFDHTDATLIQGSGGTTTCVYLNGQNVTMGGRILVAGTVNLFGSGSITKNSSYGTSYTYQFIFNNDAGRLHIYGGTYSVSENSHTVNTMAISATAKVFMYGGELNQTDAGKSPVVNISKAATFNMYGGTITGGKTTGNGGNVYMTNGAFNMYGGEITDGEANRGGNVYVSGATFNMYGGQIYDGTATYSGSTKQNKNHNVYLSGAKLYMTGDSVIYGKGTSSDRATAVFPGSGSTVILDGNARIVNAEGQTSYPLYYGASGNYLQVDNDWTGAAYTYAIGSDATNACSPSNHPGTKFQCGEYDGTTFTAGGEGGTYTGELTVGGTPYYIVGNEDGTMTVQRDKPTQEPEVGTPVVGVFDPAGCGDMAYCQACMAQGVTNDPVEWTPITSALGKAAGGHYYLTADVTCSGTGSWFLYANKADVCINLNGHNVTVAEGSTDRVFQSLYVLNIMDYTNGVDAADAVVTGGATDNANHGSAVHVSHKSGEVNIYGGTFTTTATSQPVILIYEGGTVNMHDGTITMENATSTMSGACVQVRGSTDTSNSNAGPAVFEMYDGTIQGGTTTGADAVGAAVCVGWNSTSDATFTMHDGTIQGGEAAFRGGNVGVTNGQTFNMIDGTIQDGEANRGGNVYVSGDAKFNMSGGEIKNGFANYTGDLTERYNHNVYLNASTMYMSGGTITNNQACEGTQRGTAIFPGTGSTVILDGTAAVVNGQGVSDSLSFPIYMSKDATNVLKVTGGWTGNAHMYFAHESGNGFLLGETTSDKGQSGTYENGAFTQSNVEFTGVLTVGANGYRVYSDNAGHLATASVGIVKAGSTDAYDVTWYKNYAAAEVAYQQGDVIRVFVDSEIELTKDVYVDSIGNAITVNGEGVLYAVDTSNDDYDGTGSWTIASDKVTIVRDVINPINQNRYINLSRGSVIESHRLGLQLIAVSLRPAQSNSNGMYYKATIACDADLAAAVNSYGVVLSKINMPGADFLVGTEANENAWTLNEDLSFPEGKNSVTVTSGILQGIMKDTKTSAKNAEDGKKQVFANAYLAIDADNNGTPEYYMSNNSDVKYSLFDVLDAIDTDWDAYADHQETVAKFYNYWAEKGMNAWASELPAIVAKADTLQG